jgi:predicted O-methyltransferase YrrM
MADEYEFTYDWFSATAPVWRSMIGDIKPRRALELGAFEGRSAVFLIENCAPFGRFEIACIDTWGGGGEHKTLDMAEVEARFDRNMAHAKAKHDCVVNKIKADTTTGMARLIADGQAGSYDVAYIDASHEAPDVLTDAALAFKLVRVGGVLIFDDYLWQPDERRDLLRMPKMAIDFFINTYIRKLNVIAGAPLRQIYVAKISD